MAAAVEEGDGWACCSCPARICFVESEQHSDSASNAWTLAYTAERPYDEIRRAYPAV